MSLLLSAPDDRRPDPASARPAGIPEQFDATWADTSLIGAYIVQHGCFVWANRQFERATGYEPGKLTGSRSLSIVSAEDRLRVREQARGMLDGTVTAAYGYRFCTRAGEIRWALETVAPITYLGAPAVLGHFMDITEQKHAETRLQELLSALREQFRAVAGAQAQSQAVLDASEDGLALIGPQRRFLAVNRRFAGWLGAEPDWLVQRLVDDVRPLIAAGFNDAAWLNELLDAADQARACDGARFIVQDHPVRRELALFSTPVHGGLAGDLGLLVVLRDVTHEREVDRMKSEFIALVSHELRTPLTSIKGYIDLLLEDATIDPGDRSEFLTIIADNANRLMGLVNDLLDLSRIESGKVELRCTPHDPALSVQEAICLLRVQTGAKAQRVSFEAEPDLIVMADHDRLIQIFVNLISNASKYTPAGGRIELRLRRDGDCICVEVQDSGIGLTAEEQGQLFTRFFRANNQCTQSVGGTGLGLSIVRSLVEMHGGTVTLVSTPGEGSTFTVLLPSTELREDRVADGHSASAQPGAA